MGVCDLLPAIYSKAFVYGPNRAQVAQAPLEQQRYYKSLYWNITIVQNSSK